MHLAECHHSESHLMLIRRKVLIYWKCFQAVLKQKRWKVLLPWSTWIKVVFMGLNGNVLKCFAWEFFFWFIQVWYKSISQTEMRNLSVSDSRFSECLIVAIWSNNTIWISVLSLNRRQCLLGLWRKSHISVSI